MDNNFWQDIAPLVSAVFGGGGLIALILARKERKATLKEKEANTVLLEANVAKISQGVYQGIITDLKNEIQGLRNEVFMLREIVESYKSKCEGCPMNNSNLPKD